MCVCVPPQVGGVRDSVTEEHDRMALTTNLLSEVSLFHCLCYIIIVHGFVLSALITPPWKVLGS